MPHTQTFQIQIGPLTLPLGVTVDAVVAPGTGGAISVTITGSTTTSIQDTATLLHDSFALLMTEATAEGVGTPVFS